MKVYIISVLLLIFYNSVISQNEPEKQEQWANLFEITIGKDLTEHRYWSHYLKRHKKESIVTNDSIKEGYRLIYWGYSYFAIVEIFQKNTIFEIIVDSVSSQNETKLYRSFDSLISGYQIQNIRKLCEELINEADKESPYIYEIADDDRDNWAFEFKIDNQNYTIEGYEVNKEFAEIIKVIMDIGSLSSYTIYDQKGGRFNK